MTPEQLNERLDVELKHLATKEDVAKTANRSTVTVVAWMIVLQVPTWIAIGQIWMTLVNLASKLPKP